MPPVTIPVVLPTAAMVPEALLQVPPAVESAKVMVNPPHTENEDPVMAAGTVFTVTI